MLLGDGLETREDSIGAKRGDGAGDIFDKGGVETGRTLLSAIFATVNASGIVGGVLLFTTSFVVTISSSMDCELSVDISAFFASSYSLSFRAFSALISSASFLELDGLLESSESDRGLQYTEFSDHNNVIRHLKFMYA